MSDEPPQFTTDSGEPFSSDPTGRAAYRRWDGVKWGDQVTDGPDQPPRPDRFTAQDFRQLRRPGEPNAHPVFTALLLGIGVTLGGLFVAFMIGANQPDAEAAKANAGAAVAAALAAGVAGIVVAVATYVRLRRARSDARRGTETDDDRDTVG